MDRYFGKYSGIVKDNSDDNNLGHLQLSVPALFPPDELIEARPALPYGLFFIPEKDQRVWVEFEAGDPGLPIWTGVQSIPGAWPDEAKADPPQKRVIKTEAGHLVVLDDKSGEIDVKLGGAAPHEIQMTSAGVTVKHATAGDLKLDSSGLTLETAAGAKITVTPSGITIDAGAGMVQVKASSIMLGAAAAIPVARLGDIGVGNLGAPVAILTTPVPPSTTVLA